LKLFTISLFLISSAIAQQPGIIKVETVHGAKRNSLTTVTATAGNVQCLFQNVEKTTARIACSLAGKGMLMQEISPEFRGKPSGGSCPNGRDEVSWILEVRTVGVMSYTVTANGTTRGGNF